MRQFSDSLFALLVVQVVHLCDTVAQWLALPAHSKKVVCSFPTLGPFCVEFVCSVCFVCYALWLPPTVHKLLRKKKKVRSTAKLEIVYRCKCEATADPSDPEHRNKRQWKHTGVTVVLLSCCKDDTSLQRKPERLQEQHSPVEPITFLHYQVDTGFLLVPSMTHWPVARVSPQCVHSQSAASEGATASHALLFLY